MLCLSERNLPFAASYVAFGWCLRSLFTLGHGVATNDSVANKHALVIGDILRLPSNSDAVSVLVTWENEIHVDLGYGALPL